MVMGDTCTRGCRFCSVNTSRKPSPLDPEEPTNVARAIAEMELDYVVLTSVDRDDIVDGGASHFASCISAIRTIAPKTMVEVLIPDFQGHIAHLAEVVMAGPEVIAHNVETIERLTKGVRDPRVGYRQSLDVLSAIKRMDPTRYTKSSLMVGLGETEEEVLTSMQHIRDEGVDFLTLGQYLRPTKRHLAVKEFVHPDVFGRYEQRGLEMGFKYVASGPLVRSSYKAGEFFIREYIGKKDRAASPQGAE
jgi:lipoic acid synthetase